MIQAPVDTTMTKLLTVAVVGKVSLSKLVKLLDTDPSDFWALLAKLRPLHSEPYRDFCAIAQALELDLRDFMGQTTTRNEYEQVWTLVRKIVLLGESDPDMIREFMRPYLDHIQSLDQVWHAKAWTILMLYEQIVQLPDQTFRDKLIKRMSVQGENETAELLLGSPPPPPERWIVLPENVSADVLDMGLQSIGLRRSTSNRLRRSQVTTVGQVIGLTRSDVLSCKLVGEDAMRDLQKKVPEYLLSQGVAAVIPTQ
jgi:hypothetical protein